MKQKIYFTLAGVAALCVGALIAEIQSKVEKSVGIYYPQQNVEVTNLSNLAQTFTPTDNMDVLATFTLTHLDKSTTSFKLVTFSTTTAVAGFYAPSDGSLSVRVDNWEKRKRYQEEEKDVPVVNISILVHEIVHMTTLYNTKGVECQSVYNAICQEKMAYDAGYIYEQIRSFEEDGLLVLSKN